MQTSYFLSFTSLLALTSAHGVILGAQGEDGSPASVGFQVNPDIARNCTSINPCQQDATIIRDAEIAANTVNECGRTELAGNIDIGENTENALSANAVTEVKAGTKMTVTIHQVNADGAGPYTCDLIEAGNNGVISQNLTVENNVPGSNGFSQAKEQQFNVTVTMPDSFNCVGASTGNVCTVRCRNNAQAGPFGGCFAVQQTDNTANVNTASNIETNLSAEKVDKQVAVDQANFPAAVKANQDAGTPEALANLAAAQAVGGLEVTSRPAATETPDVILGGNAASATPTNDANAAAETGNGNGRNGRNRKGNNNKRDRIARRYVMAGKDFNAVEQN